MTEIAPAYYSRGTTGWRAWWSILHPPYTLMHLSFVVVGAAFAPALDLARLALTLLAFFLGMGIAAHCLDEWNGRPLGTSIRSRVLVATAVAALVAAALVGYFAATHYDLVPGLAFIPIGVFFALAYNLEWFSGRFHTDAAFALAWGAFPALVAFYAQTGSLGFLAGAAAIYAFIASLLQRHLSTSARALRRKTATVSGRIVHHDGSEAPIDRAYLLRLSERPLRLLVHLSLALALLLVLGHAVRGTLMAT